MTNKEVQTAQRDLSMAISGAVATTGDAAYARTITIDNGRVNRRPQLVVIPADTKDVATTVRYCHKQGIRLTVKSGGHSAAGYCLNFEGIVLDLRSLNAIASIDGGAGLSVGMGARWIQLYSYIQERQSDRIIIGGGCGGVGIGGFLLGGGYSFASRSFGLACDSVKRMELVAASGEIHQLHDKLTNKEEADLFWALKGGGGGNFGIVTNVNLRLHTTPSASMMMGQVNFPFYRIHEILPFYNNWVSTLPNEMAVYGMLRRFPDPRQGGRPTLFIRLFPVYNGKFSDGEALLRPLINLQPTSIELYAMTLPQWEKYVGNDTLVDGRSAYIRSVMLPPKSLNADFTEICMKYLGMAPSADSYIVWTHTGGAIKNSDTNTSCFAHRDAEFLFELKSIWSPAALESDRANIEWSVNFFDELEAYAQGAYVNYIDPLLTDWQYKYYRDSYPRLMKIKKHVDPSDVWGFQQGIGSTFSPGRQVPLDLSPLTRT